MHLSIQPETMFYIGSIPITDTVVYTWAIMAVLVFGAILFRIAIEKSYKMEPQVPAGAANFAEMITGGINGVAKDNLHHHWRPFAPYIATIGLFLVIANTVGMYGFGLKPPTRDFNLPFALACMSIILLIASVIHYKGLFGFIKSFFEPVWWLFPLKIIEVFARLISLTARLFGNILAAFIIMEIIVQALEYVFQHTFIGPGLPAIFSLYFDIFDGILQAVVFTFLTTLYISEGLE